MKKMLIRGQYLDISTIRKTIVSRVQIVKVVLGLRPNNEFTAQPICYAATFLERVRIIRKLGTGEWWMRTEGKALSWRTIGLLFALIAVLVLVTVWAQAYYSKKVFYVEGIKYTQYADLGQGRLEYRAFLNRGEPIYVQTGEDVKRVVISGEVFDIRPRGVDSGQRASYEVIFPEGKTYLVKPFGDKGFLTYDEKGERVLPGFRIISGGIGQDDVSDPAQPHYDPSELVVAADAWFHVQNGSIGFFLLALGMLIYAWCGFRYEAFQRFLFHISPSHWMIVNPEPSDFYFFMCKVGGIFGMGFSLWIFFAHAL